MLASDWPLVTVSPTLTDSVVSTPEVGNDRSAEVTGSKVPLAVMLEETEPRDTACVVVVVVTAAACSPELRKPNHHTPAATKATTTTADADNQIHRRRGRLALVATPLPS